MYKTICIRIFKSKSLDDYVENKQTFNQMSLVFTVEQPASSWWNTEMPDLQGGDGTEIITQKLRAQHFQSPIKSPRFCFLPTCFHSCFHSESLRWAPKQQGPDVWDNRCLSLWLAWKNCSREMPFDSLQEEGIRAALLFGCLRVLPCTSALALVSTQTWPDT